MSMNLSNRRQNRRSGAELCGESGCDWRAHAATRFSGGVPGICAVWSRDIGRRMGGDGREESAKRTCWKTRARGERCALMIFHTAGRAGREGGGGGHVFVDRLESFDRRLHIPFETTGGRGKAITTIGDAVVDIVPRFKMLHTVQ